MTKRHKMIGALKSRKTRRGVAVVSCGILVAFSVASWLVAGALIAPANRAVGPLPVDFHAVTTSLASDSGAELAAWYLPADDADATVLLLHPNRGNRRTMLGRARLLHAAGYAVLLVDLQAHGESPGDHVTAGDRERHDVCAAVRFARRTNPDHRIGIIGWSLGGAAALLASPADVDALVLESVYPTIADAVHNRVSIRAGLLSYLLSPALLCQLRPRIGVTPDDLRPIDHIDDIDCPILLMAGDVDRHTPLAETLQMFAAARQPKQLAIFQGAAHVDLLSYDPAQYSDRVLSFLSAHLGAPQVKQIIAE